MQGVRKYQHEIGMSIPELPEGSARRANAMDGWRICYDEISRDFCSSKGAVVVFAHAVVESFIADVSRLMRRADLYARPLKSSARSLLIQKAMKTGVDVRDCEWWRPVDRKSGLSNEDLMQGLEGVRHCFAHDAGVLGEVALPSLRRCLPEAQQGAMLVLADQLLVSLLSVTNTFMSCVAHAFTDMAATLGVAGHPFRGPSP